LRLLDALKAKEPLTKEEAIRPLISDSQSEVLFAPSFVDLLPVKRYLGNGIFHFRNNRICCFFTICKNRRGFGRIFCTVFETVCSISVLQKNPVTIIQNISES
jgi:hypothetical protein